MIPNIKSLLEKDFVQVSANEYGALAVKGKECYAVMEGLDKQTYWKPKPQPEKYPKRFEGGRIWIDVYEDGDININEGADAITATSKEDIKALEEAIVCAKKLEELRE